VTEKGSKIHIDKAAHGLSLVGSQTFLPGYCYYLKVAMASNPLSQPPGNFMIGVVPERSCHPRTFLRPLKAQQQQQQANGSSSGGHHPLLLPSVVPPHGTTKPAILVMKLDLRRGGARWSVMQWEKRKVVVEGEYEYEEEGWRLCVVFEGKRLSSTSDIPLHEAARQADEASKLLARSGEEEEQEEW